MTTTNLTGGPARLLLATRVAIGLRRELRDGGWEVGNKLPNEKDLASQYGVGLNTMRRVLASLVREGVLRRSQGSGTFVAAIPNDDDPRSRKPLVGVVLPAEKYYAGGVLDGICESVSGAGCQLLISYATFEPNLELQRCAELVQLGARGLIVSPSLYNCRRPAAHLEHLRGFGVPIVLVGRRPPDVEDEETSYVTTDMACGVQLAFTRLAARGRRRVSYFGRDGAQCVEVRRAFGRERERRGLAILDQVDATRASWGPRDLQEYVRACQRHRVEAVLCMDDRKALLLEQALMAAGMRVPDDIEILAYDATVCEDTLTPLTTITPAKRDIGELAGNLVARMIAAGSSAATCHIDISPRLDEWPSSSAQPRSAPARHRPTVRRRKSPWHAGRDPDVTDNGDLVGQVARSTRVLAERPDA